MTNRLPLQKLSTKSFTWDARSRKFVAEVSDLGGRLPGSRVFADAADFGFTLVSERTGEEMTMFLEGDSEGPEGEILYWTFKPERGANLFAVRIYND